MRGNCLNAIFGLYQVNQSRNRGLIEAGIDRGPTNASTFSYLLYICSPNNTSETALPLDERQTIFESEYVHILFIQEYGAKAENDVQLAG
jgi:hypothetical protein